MSGSVPLSISTSLPRAHTEPEETFPNPSYAITSHPDTTPPAVYKAIGITGQIKAQEEREQEVDYI